MEQQSFDGLQATNSSPLGGSVRPPGTFHERGSNKQSLGSYEQSRDENSFSLNSEVGGKTGTLKKDTLSN